MIDDLSLSTERIFRVIATTISSSVNIFMLMESGYDYKPSKTKWVCFIGQGSG